MSDIKFTCPSCGQRIKCDHTHAGHQIPCPGCHQNLVIPRIDPSQPPDVQLPAATLAGAPKPKAKVPAPAEPPSRDPKTVVVDPSAKAAPPAEQRSTPELPKPSSAQPKPPPPPPAAPEGISCLCPRCHSELRVRPRGKTSPPTGTLPVAELVRPGSTGIYGATQNDQAAQPTQPAAPSTPKGKDTAGKPSSPPSARPGGSLKPRLSYILTGQPPAPPPRPDGAPRKKKAAQPAPKPSSGTTEDSAPATE